MDQPTRDDMDIALVRIAAMQAIKRKTQRDTRWVEKVIQRGRMLRMMQFIRAVIDRVLNRVGQ